MKRITLLLLGLTTLLLKVKSQSETPKDFWNNRTSFQTDGTGKSQGLKIKLSVPSSWKIKEGTRPHIVKNFSAPTVPVFCTLTIDTWKGSGKNSITESELRDFAKSLTKIISTKLLKVDGLSSGEIVFENTTERPVGTIFMKGIEYVIPYNGKVIVVLYSVGSTNKQDTDKYYNDYESLFKGLASTTAILSQWE
jgi:hypothetical protein